MQVRGYFWLRENCSIHNGVDIRRAAGVVVVPEAEQKRQQQECAPSCCRHQFAKGALLAGMESKVVWLGDPENVFVMDLIV